jgi:predicted metal-dependent hydrolase
MEVRVSYSTKRKRTVSAKVNGNFLDVTAPSMINKQQLEKIVEELKEKIKRRKTKEKINRDKLLDEVAAKFNKKYFDGRVEVRSIEYSSRQNRRYGSCNHITGQIRISSRLKEMPVWVRDYVIVHEMAHLLEPNHGKAFRKLVNRYKLAERARGYLLAAGRV